MPEIRVSSEDRPSILKYTLFTLAGVVLVSGFVATVVGSYESPIVRIVGTTLAAVGNLAILFVMVQSLVEEWFAAAEVVDD